MWSNPLFPALLGLVLAGQSMAQGVDVIGMDPDPATLAEALAIAPERSEIVVTGSHSGNFVIDRPLVLRGSGGAVLDGGGLGTVLTILADDVTVEGLVLTGSALSGDYWQAWGPAGLRVEGDRAVLSDLTLRGNAWGVLFRDGEGSVLHNSLILDNQRDGVTIMGGREHEIAGNRIAGNRIAGNRIAGNRKGIVIDAIYGDNDRVLLPLAHDPAWSQEVGRLQSEAVPAIGHRVLANSVTGNGETGILLHYHVREVLVAENVVHRTGTDRAPDAAEAAFWAAEMGGASFTPVNLSGSGILLFCWPEENLVTENHVHGNLAVGIGLEIVGPDNRIEANLVEDNAIGLFLSAATDNTLRANRVFGNAEYGILVDFWLWMGQGRSDGNLIALNDLAGNAINAFDGSGRILTVEEIAEQFPLMPWPEEMRAIYGNPAVALQMAQGMVAMQIAAANRWHDGRHGKRHDDFDTEAEGFVDPDGDGIGEIGREIPGGNAVDTRPLSPEALVAALAEAGR